MVRPARVAVTLTVLLVLAGTVGGVGTAAATPTQDHVGDSPRVSDRPDPETDVIGWEDGYWYNESIDVDRSDGLSKAELEIVVARAMARVEVIRQLEFKDRVPVRIISRETFREQNAGLYANVSTKTRLHQNVKFEALFMVDESTNTIDVQQQNRGTSVLGYYNYQTERIVIVSEDTESPQMNEITLAQELFHAIQDQYFNLSNYSRVTEEQNNAVNGIVEGDGNYVDYLYNQRCESGSWGNCLMPQGESGGGGDLANVGIYLLGFQPYSDGPGFVARFEERGGWEAVNAIYKDPPESTEQTIHPEKYGVDAPTNVTIEDRSTGDWRILDLEDGVNYAEFGEAGIFSMFWFASYEATQRSGTPETVVVSYRDLFNTQAGGSLDPLDPYNYSSRYSAGWDGDRLLPYVTNASAINNETGYVWKTTWDSPAEAREFYTGYQRLLEYHDAERVGANTYRIPTDSGFNDAFHVMVEGETVTIVNGPSVADLSQINADVEVRTVTPTASVTPTDRQPTITETRSATTPPTATVSPDNPTVTPASPETTSPGQPGFGGAVGIAAVLVLLLGYWMRRR